MEVLFWLFTILILYTYLGYPALLAVAAKYFSRGVDRGKNEPYVSVIISAFNEERFIEEKLANLLDSDYPMMKMEILIGSDGGSDKTDHIVARFPSARIRFFRFVKNLGKPHVLNGLIQEAHGAILIFTDARQRFDRQAIRRLTENFNDPKVGCVSGELHFEKARGSGVAMGMDAYWRYEKFMRKRESEIGSMLGATGAIYAIRRHLFPEVPVNILADDMFIPLSIVANGFRAVFDGSAKAFDLVSEESGSELVRKIRTLTGNFQIFRHFPSLLLSPRSPVAWQLISHKFLRLVVPYSLIGTLVTNAFLIHRPFYVMLFAAQAFFYLLSVTELVLLSVFRRRKGIGYIPYTFCLLNFAAVVALVKFLTEEQRANWRKAYK